MDDGTQPSGIERAAQQGTDAFQAQQFPDPVPAPPPPMPIGPPTEPGSIHDPSTDMFSRPYSMQGGWHVAGDGMSWWNGAMWVPGRPPGSSPEDSVTDDSPTSPSAAPLVLFLVGLAIMAAIAFIAWQAFQVMAPPPPGF